MPQRTLVAKCAMATCAASATAAYQRISSAPSATTSDASPAAPPPPPPLCCCCCCWPAAASVSAQVCKPQLVFVVCSRRLARRPGACNSEAASRAARCCGNASGNPPTDPAPSEARPRGRAAACLPPTCPRDQRRRAVREHDRPRQPQARRAVGRLHDRVRHRLALLARVLPHRARVGQRQRVARACSEQDARRHAERLRGRARFGAGRGRGISLLQCRCALQSTLGCLRTRF